VTDGPRIIAIETTSRRGGIALAVGDQIVASHTLAVDRDYAADLLPAADALCRQVGWRPDAVEQVFVSIGPGSFTGTRIGVTFAKTLALAARAKVVAVPTFDALALNGLDLRPPPADLVVFMDARGGEVFAEMFRLSGESQVYESVRPGQLVPLADLLSDARHPVAFAGEGVAVHRKVLLETGNLMLPQDLCICRVERVHQVGRRLAQQGRFSEVDTLIPVYYRLPTPVERLATRERQKGAGENGPANC